MSRARALTPRALAPLALAALALAAAGRPAALGAQEPERVREADPEVRRERMERLRAYPGTRYDQDAVAVARAAMAALPRRASILSAWRALGPFGFLTSGFYGSAPGADGGRIRTLAVHPTNPAIVYAGAASGGVWRSITGGASWTPLTDTRCTLNTGTIALDPVDPTIVYVGTGEPAQSTGCGLLRSFDAGNSWTEINGAGVLAPTNGTAANQGYRLRVDRATAGSRTTTTVLYAASNGVHRSTNSGTTWGTVLSGFATDLEQDPARDSVFYAALGGGGANTGVWRSADRGVTWTQLWRGSATGQRYALAVSPAAPGQVWVAEVVSGRLNALVRVDAATGAATPLDIAGVYGVTTRLDFAGQSTYNLVLEVDPADAAVVYVGGSRLYRTRNGAGGFTVAAYDLHVDWHALEFAPGDPGVVYAGNDGGVFVSHDRGNGWVSRNTDISVTQFYTGVAVHPTIPDLVVGGFQDNSSLWGSGTGFWTMSAPSGDGGFNLWNPVNPAVFYSTSYSPGYIVRAVRAPLGAGVTTAFRGFTTTDREAWMAPLALDPATGTTLYYGTYRLWRSTNEGLSWAPLTGDLTKGSGTITALAVSPADPRVLWVGTSDGNVQLSLDGGATFAVVSAALPNRAVTDLVADPADARRAWATYSGTGTGKVFATADQGATWGNLSTGLPDIPFNAVAIVPGTARLFAAADVGVYESADGGATWAVASAGIPNARVTDLVYQAATGILYAATYGRGLWAATVLAGDAVLRGDVNRDGAVNAFDAVLVQQALVGITPASGQPPLPAGDANCNGGLDAGDVLAILQFAVGSAPPALCVGRAA